MGSDGLVAVYYMLAIIGVIVVLHGDGLLPASCWVGHDGYVCNAANPPSKGVVPCWESVLIWDRSTRGKWCRPGNHGRDFENWGGLRGLATSTVSHHEPVAASSVRGRVRAYQWVHAPTGRRRYQACQKTIRVESGEKDGSARPFQLGSFTLPLLPSPSALTCWPK